MAAAEFHLPCVREGGTRSVPEGLSATIFNNPSVSKLTAPLAEKRTATGALLPQPRRQFAVPVQGKVAREACRKGCWCRFRQSLSQQADSSLYTREPVLGEALYADNGGGGISPSLCKGRWHAKRAGRVVGNDFQQSLSQQADSSFSRKTHGNRRFIATAAASIRRPCAREGGTRSVPEGLLVQISTIPQSAS